MQLDYSVIHNSWHDFFKIEWTLDYFSNLLMKLKNDEDEKLYPCSTSVLKAYSNPIEKIKVVILGQDPYHRPNQAMGLSFSVPRNIRIPASLKRIFKELEQDIGCRIPDHGDLTSWFNEGVMLLNAILTVNEGKPGSHSKYGWQNLTDNTIKYLSDNCNHIVFILWGNFAKSKRHLICSSKHLILESVHPSPFTREAFFGNNHFSQANEYLKTHNRKPINWQIT